MTPAINESKENSSFLKTKIIVGAAFLLILALGFNALLTSSSLEKLYVESLASSYQVFGKDLQIHFTEIKIQYLAIYFLP